MFIHELETHPGDTTGECLTLTIRYHRQNFNIMLFLGGLIRTLCESSSISRL